MSNVLKGPARDQASEESATDIPCAGAQAPVPELVNEFGNLYDQLDPLIQATQDGQGQTVRMMIAVPEEWAVLAAWLALRERKRWANDLSPLPDGIMLDERFTRGKHISRYMRQVLNDHFHHQLHLLAIGAHPYLYPSKAKQKSDDAYDDGIPF